MAKDFIINTDNLNGYGYRVLTAGMDYSQYQKNPVLLYMHQRGWDGKTLPIGRVDNLRVENGVLLGTPVFDMEDPFAAQIGRKWENGFLRMCSAGADPIEVSSDPKYLLPGQTRATVVRSKLVEVSIADIGANDDSLQLYAPGGKLITLAAGEDNEYIPLLEQQEKETEQEQQQSTNQNNLKMNQIFLTLGLPATATEADAVAAIKKLQHENKTAAEQTAAIQLSRITTAVDAAIATRKVTADKRESLIKLGKDSGFDNLELTLSMIAPVQKPTELIHAGSQGTGGTIKLSYSELSEEQLQDLSKNNQQEFCRLFKAEFGFPPTLD